MWSRGVTCSSVPGVRKDLLSISVCPGRSDGPRCGQTAAEFLRPGRTESLGRTAQVNKHTFTRWLDQLRDYILYIYYIILLYYIKNSKLFLHLKWTLLFLHFVTILNHRKRFSCFYHKGENSWFHFESFIFFPATQSSLCASKFLFGVFGNLQKQFDITERTGEMEGDVWRKAWTHFIF